MNFEFYSQTDTGRVRTNNEDSVALDESCAVAVLADGMGGYNAGEVAAGMATRGVLADLAAWLDRLPRPVAPHHVSSALEICIENANRAIHSAAHAQPQWVGMGTTLVAAVFCPTHVVVGHVGDSRCYRVRGGAIEQLTRDHSWLQEQLDAGSITAQQAAQSSQRHLVTRALGIERTVRAEVNEHPLHSGDLLLLCSDGLSEMLRDADMLAILDTCAPLQDKVQCLVNAANLRGGRDNISVVLVQAGPAPADRPALAPQPHALAPLSPPVQGAAAATLSSRKRNLLARWLRCA